MRYLAIGVYLIYGLSAAWCAAALGPAAWDFEGGADGWSGPGNVVAEDDVPGNHTYRIVATQPHHTRVVLEGSGATPNFLVSLRVRVLEWEGAPPNAYVYGRHGSGGFRALCVGRDGGRAFCYYGQDEPSVSLGDVAARLPDASEWIHLAFACVDDYAFAKTWPAGAPEPAWQAEGRDPHDLDGVLALGVWTSPRQPSTATVLFDDIRFEPLTGEALAAHGLRVGAWPPLDASVLPADAGVFEEANRRGVATPCTALAFDSQTGAICNVLDRATGQEFIAPDSRQGVFRVRLTKPADGVRVELSSRDFQSVAVREEPTGALALEFTHHIAYAVEATVTAAPAGDGTIRLGIRVRNGEPDWCVAGISFPSLPGSAGLGGDDSDDALLIPWDGGAVLRRPGSENARRSVSYPGAAFAQFYALYDRAAGLYCGMHDAEGHCKSLSLWCAAGQSVSLGFEHLFPELPGRDARLPYDVVVRTFQGDWREAAALYKAWAVRQPWCGKRLTEREDIPAFLKEGAGVIITGIENAEGRARLLGERLEKLPDLMDAYRGRTGLKHMIFVPYGWENRGTWAGINYLPAVPSNELWREANAALKSRGHRTAFLTSGFWWVIKRQETGSGPAFDDTDDFLERQGMCVHGADGSPWLVDNYERLREHGSWRGLSATLCHGSPEARDTMKRIFLDVAGLGVPLVSFDQEIGGRQVAPCYHPGHGHPPGYGRWMWTGFEGLCEEILEEGKPIEPELGLFLENVSELAIPCMATYWSRQFGEVDVGVRNGRGVGLFSYLYHEYVTAIGAACVQGQGQRGIRPSAGLRCRVLANNLTRGLIPGPFMHEVPLDTDKEWEGLVSRAYFAFCKPYAHFPEYLLLGETLPPIPVECGETEVWFARIDERNGTPLKPGGPPVAKVPLRLPAITSGAFAAADGSVAAVLANTTPEAQQCKAGLPGGQDVRIYTAERIEEGARVTEDTGESLPLELEPFGVRVIVMTDAAGRRD
ncbi:MAG: hypothetical protein JXR94_14715 [Candidatus Hydrogenedentes bacterium]|nr:hypothetical protein [Candidatus Hydrogenedentota bacterium]